MPTPEIMAGIARFQEHFQANQELFDHLALEGQEPRVLFFACSDSRVIPELITGANPGDLFVSRNLANIIPPYGVGEMAVGTVIEFALLHLSVEQIIVCGHTDCGGIHALDRPADWSREPHIARWIEHARPAQTRVEASGLPVGDWHLATVRENVLLQLGNLRSYDPVRLREGSGMLSLHGWVYHLETGAVEAYDPYSATWQLLGPEEQNLDRWDALPRV